MARQGPLGSLRDFPATLQPARSCRFCPVEPAVLQGRKRLRHRWHDYLLVGLTAIGRALGPYSAGDRLRGPLACAPARSCGAKAAPGPLPVRQNQPAQRPAGLYDRVPLCRKRARLCAAPKSNRRFPKYSTEIGTIQPLTHVKGWVGRLAAGSRLVLSRRMRNAGICQTEAAAIELGAGFPRQRLWISVAAGR